MYSLRSLRACGSGARRSLPAAPALAALAFSTLLIAGAVEAQAPAPSTTLRDAMARGETLLAAGQYQFALREFEALRRANPSDPTPLLGIGKAQEGLGRGKAAERSYHDFIAERPTDALGYANLGHVLESLGRNDDALQSYRNAQRLDPRSAAAARGAGLTLQALGRKQEALRSLREASKLDADDATTWGALALLSLDLDRGIDAASYWEEAMRRDPGYFDSRPDERKRWEKLMSVVGPQLTATPPASAPAESPARMPMPVDSLAAETSGPNHPGARRIDEASVSSFARGSSSSGSGFIVSRENGYVLTNKHVVRGCAAVKVRMAGGESRPATVHAFDRDDDLALLETRLPQGPAVTFRDDPAVRPGDDVVAVGYPLNGLLADQVNVSTGTVNALAGLYNDLHVLQMSAPVQPGSSGGALFDASGNVVGVVVTKLNAKLVADETGDIPQNVNFAVKAAVARDFLKSQHVTFRTAPSTARRSNADVGEIGRQVTVLVECWK